MKISKGIIPFIMSLSVQSVWSQDPPIEPLAPPVPKFELVLENSGEPHRVGDRISVRLQGSALSENSRLEQGGGVDQGFQVTEDGKLIPLRPGSIQLPALTVIDAQGNRVGETDPVAFEVSSVLDTQTPGEPPQPEPAEGPQDLGLPWSVLAPLGIILLALVSLAAWKLSQWLRRPRKIFESPAVSESPDRIAMKRLARTEEERYMSKGQAKRHFFEISETLKGYFSDRFEIDARESTTSELFHLLSQLCNQGKIPSEEVDSIRECFETLDLVKFTNYEPSLEEGIAQLDIARKIVQRTRPRMTGPVLTPPGIEMGGNR